MADIDDTLPIDGQDVDKEADIRANWTAIKGRIGTLRDSGFVANQVVVGKSDGSGIDQASTGQALDLDGCSLGNAKGSYVEVSGTLTIDGDNYADYMGRTLLTTNATSATITVSDANGLPDSFVVGIFHIGAGSLAVAGGGGLTLRNPSSHTTVVQYGRAVLERFDGDLSFQGATAA